MHVQLQGRFCSCSVPDAPGHRHCNAAFEAHQSRRSPESPCFGCSQPAAMIHGRICSSQDAQDSFVLGPCVCATLGPTEDPVVEFVLFVLISESVAS